MRRKSFLVPIMTDWQAYTPTFAGLGSPTSIAMYWRRVGDSVQIQGRFTVGTPTTTEARIGLPTGLTSSSIISTLELVGVIGRDAFAATYFATYSTIEPSVTYLTVSQQTSAVANLTKSNGDTAFGTGNIASVSLVTIPIAGWKSNRRIF